MLDFNLYLSAHDVWTAGILPTADGAGIVTFDKSCTTPVVSSNPASPTPFVNFAYTGTNADGATASLDRTREGYVEIIEMGDVTGPTAVGVTHVARRSAVHGPRQLRRGDQHRPGFGRPVRRHDDHQRERIGRNQRRRGRAGRVPHAADAPIWAPPNSIQPDLTQAAPPQAEIFQGGTVVLATFLTGIDAVSAAMMHNSVMNEYVLDSGTASRTDWVLTYPTKRYYVFVGTGTRAAEAVPAQLQRRPAPATTSTIAFWDREEQTPAGPPGGFSPPPPGSPNPALCWEANIVTWNNSNVFSSTNSVNIATPYQNGWGLLGLVGGATAPIHQLVSTTNQTFNGLPVVGFSTNTFYNGGIPPCWWRHDPVGVCRELQAQDDDADPIRRPVEAMRRAGFDPALFFRPRPSTVVGTGRLGRESRASEGLCNRATASRTAGPRRLVPRLGKGGCARERRDTNPGGDSLRTDARRGLPVARSGSVAVNQRLHEL